jgi:hypothetical protein
MLNRLDIKEYLEHMKYNEVVPIEEMAAGLADLELDRLELSYGYYYNRNLYIKLRSDTKPTKLIKLGKLLNSADITVDDHGSCIQVWASWL